MKPGELSNILNHSQSIVELSEELNARAGYRLFNFCPLQQIFEEVMNGGSRKLGKVDVERLIYPQIPQSLIDKVRDENPEQVKIDGRKFPVVYGLDEKTKCYYAVVLVDDELVDFDESGNGRFAKRSETRNSLWRQQGGKFFRPSSNIAARQHGGGLVFPNFDIWNRLDNQSRCDNKPIALCRYEDYRSER